MAVIVDEGLLKVELQRRFEMLERNGFHLADLAREFQVLTPSVRKVLEIRGEIPVSEASITHVLAGEGKITRSFVQAFDRVFFKLIGNTQEVRRDASVPLNSIFDEYLVKLPADLAGNPESAARAEDIWQKAAHAGQMVLAMRTYFDISQESFSEAVGLPLKMLEKVEREGATSEIQPRVLMRLIRNVRSWAPEWFNQAKYEQFIFTWYDVLEKIPKQFNVEKRINKKPAEGLSDEERIARAKILWEKAEHLGMRIRAIQFCLNESIGEFYKAVGLNRRAIYHFFHEVEKGNFTAIPRHIIEDIAQHASQEAPEWFDEMKRNMLLTESKQLWSDFQRNRAAGSKNGPPTERGGR